MINKIYKIILISITILLATGSFSIAKPSMKCIISEESIGKNTEVLNFLNSDISTIFMGKVNSIRIVRQGGGYKFLEIFFDVKKRDFKKGIYPESGEVKVYLPYSQSICGYSNEKYFSPGTYAVIFSKDNGRFNIIDRTTLNRVYTDELKAREFLNNIANNESIVMLEEMIVEEDGSMKIMLYLWIFIGLAVFIVIIMLLRKLQLNKKNNGYYEDSKNMYFTTKGDEIEIRVKKTKKNKL